MERVVVAHEVSSAVELGFGSLHVVCWAPAFPFDQVSFDGNAVFVLDLSREESLDDLGLFVVIGITAYGARLRIEVAVIGIVALGHRF